MFDKIKAIIANELGVNESKITLEARLAEDLGADSLDAVELIMAIEDEFGIEVSDEESKKIHCVKDIVDYVESVTK